jgi:hypothetical protein
MIGSDTRGVGATAAPASCRRPLRVGSLDNPRSGGNRRRPGALERALGEDAGLRHRRVQTPADVAEALADFARDGIEVVAINGGDGTIQAALTAVLGERLFDPPPLFAVLTAGTTSMISRDVGLRGSRAEALRRLLRWAQSPDERARLVERPVLRLEHAPGAPPQFGMFFGAAGIEQGIRFCLTRIHTLGVSGEPGAGLALAALLSSLARGRRDVVHPVPVTTALDDGPPERRDHLVLMVTTLERLVVGLRPFWGDGTAPLHYTAVLGHPRRLLAALPRVLRGRPGGAATADNGYVSRDVSEVRVWLEGTGYTLDGEMFTGHAGRGPVVLRAGGCVSFVCC